LPQVAHPPPRRLNPSGVRRNKADLSAAEISTANMARRGRGTQILVEHNHAGGRVGTVLASWEGNAGELRVEGVIDDPAAQRAVKSGAMRELSLGTSVHSDNSEGGRVLMRTHDELSICEQAARPGCIITDIDGKRVGSSHHFSIAPSECSSR
jgi:hypothetical protein